MFTQHCFIRKNSPKLIRRLEDLGYKYSQSIVRPHSSLLVVNKGYYAINFPYGNAKGEGFIDCGKNEELFFALAALRDDKDEHQWFVMDVDAYANLNKGDWFKATDIKGQYHVGVKIEPDYCHKATVEEIMKQFSTWGEVRVKLPYGMEIKGLDSLYNK